ncbi:hypothetical protein VCRLGP8_1430557 [Vibrio crassostreae]|nr:hypothetical protein VCRLGP8_1430557 [Vibrio crassostreae]CDT46907.1 hypothetical protein VCRLGP7_720254 [Vibrio crassostreae]
MFGRIKLVALSAKLMFIGPTVIEYSATKAKVAPRPNIDVFSGTDRNNIKGLNIYR